MSKRDSVAACIGRHLDPREWPGLVWKNIKHPFTAAAQEARFDRRLGVDTASIDPRVDARGHVGYEALPYSVAEWVIDRVAPDPAGATFIDVGCGKGRVLLAAAARPFKQVVGIELSRELCEIARRNLAIRKLSARAAVVHCDALRYAFPSGPLVVFLFRPFVGEVAEAFGRRLVETYHSAPRKIIIINYTIDFPSSLSDSAFTRRELTGLPWHPGTKRLKEAGLRVMVYETPTPHHY